MAAHFATFLLAALLALVGMAIGGAGSAQAQQVKVDGTTLTPTNPTTIVTTASGGAGSNIISLARKKWLLP